MASPAENILQSLFDTQNINDVAATQLENLATEYPFYGTAHFLLVKKISAQPGENAMPSLQKAALHVSNNLWLNFILNEETLQPAKGETENFTGAINNETPASYNEQQSIETDEPIAEDFTEDAIIGSRLSSMLQKQAAVFEKPAEPVNEIPVETTPYHRIDYFESQGIKLDENKADDKLGTQLKRFTDWLKQMKRINTNTGELKHDEAGEQQVESIAATSNKPKEVVTEAMAEVLVRQGKLEQAIQIYEKLSFNNPSKSAYFAAKIQELKS